MGPQSSEQLPAQRGRSLPGPWNLGASLISMALGILLLISPRDGLSRAPSSLELPPLPFSDSAPRLVIASSPQVEMWQVAHSLTRSGAISLNTAPRVDAFKQVGRVASHPAVSLLRDSERLKMSIPGQLGYILALGPLPRLSPGRDADRWVNPEFGGVLSARERDKFLERLGDSLKDFYKEAQLESYFETRGPQYDAINQALSQALPGDEPQGELDRRLGEAGPSVLLIPSLIAEDPISITLPASEGTRPTQVLLLPLPKGELPRSQVLQAALRYEAVARARLAPLFEEFSLELQQVSRALNDATQGGASTGIVLTLSTEGLITPEDVEGSILRALFLRSIEGDDEWEIGALRDARAQGLPQVDSLVATLKTLERDPSQYPTLRTQLTHLLEGMIQSQEAHQKRAPLLGDFEAWEGDHPLGWTINTARVPGPDEILSVVERLPKSKDNPSVALRLRVPADATQWKEALSMPISVSPGESITIRARIRTLDVQRVEQRLVGAHVFALLHDSSSALVSRIQGKTLTGTEPWQESAITLEIPSTTTTLTVGLSLGMPGAADFDDVTIDIRHPDANRLLHHGDFEVAGAEAPLGWNRILGAQNAVNGPSTDSLWSLDSKDPAQGSSSLQLKGGRQTSRWFGVQSPDIRTKPGQRVALSGQLKTQGILRDDRQERNANLFLEFVNERGAVVGRQATPIVTGDTPWTTYTLEATAPIDAVWLRVGCVLSLSGTLWVDNIHLTQR